tara:strand:+ start:452 stop:715 length:264 start_codon:yes stop_codon:yes gene_type:complete
MEFKKHLFICTSCKTQDGTEGAGTEIQKELKSFFKISYPDIKIRINKSGCLSKCRQGVNAVCYPEGNWFSELKKEDTNILKEELFKN